MQRLRDRTRPKAMEGGARRAGIPAVVEGARRFRPAGLALLVAVGLLLSCGAEKSAAPPAKTSLTIFCAGSLNRAINKVARSYEGLRPEVTIKIEPSGSRVALHKWLGIGRQPDVIALADNRLLTEEAMPHHADWCLAFAGNRMVISYTERSKHTAEISADNWYEILARPGVQVGRADPNKDPCGYRTLMLLQLADRHYTAEQRKNRSIRETILANSPSNNVRPAAMELAPLLQSMQLDYVFEYLSFAVQHNLKYIELPDEINLGRLEREALYSQAAVEVSGKKPGEKMTYRGAAIVYGLTITPETKTKAEAGDFVAYLLGPEGRRIFETEGMPMLSAYKLFGSKLPENIKPLVTAQESEN